MKTVTMLELRKDAERIIRQVQRGQPMLLIYRGKPVLRLEPVREEIAEDDPAYAITRFAAAGQALTNEEIDDVLRGQ